MNNLAPLDDAITLDRDPNPICRRLRAKAPVLPVKSAGRTLLTKAEDTKYVKDNPELFSPDDPNTPMKRAFCAHTLMRKHGETFNVFRDKAPHQAFDSGEHFCMGTQVARRAVGQEMLPILFDRFPNMEVPDASDLIWRGFDFRGPVQIPVQLH